MIQLVDNLRFNDRTYKSNTKFDRLFSSSIVYFENNGYKDSSIEDLQEPAYFTLHCDFIVFQIIQSSKFPQNHNKL